MGFSDSPAMRASIVRWAESQSDKPSLSEALRRWVELSLCERHSERPWDGDDACGCGAPGAQCCNCADDGEAPLMPSGFTAQFDKKGWRH
jgi:hypothetical protein